MLTLSSTGNNDLAKRSNEDLSLEPSISSTSSMNIQVINENIVDVEKSSTHENLPTNTVPDVGPPPNGGLRAYLVVLGGFIALFNSWGLINTFGAYETYYQEVLLSHETPSTIAWIGSIQGFFVVAAAIVFGRMIDAGYIKSLVYAGTFLVTFGMMMTSISTEFYQLFLAQGVVTGIGCCCLFVSAVAVVASYFSTKRAFMIGVMASGSSIGGVIYPIMVRELIKRVGFGWATRIIAFTILGLSVLPCVFLKPRLPPRKSGPLIDYASLRDVPFILYAVACFFGFMGQYIPIFFIQSYCLKVGIDSNLAFYMTSILNSGSVAGRILPSFVADKSGPINMLLPCTAACMILAFSWAAITNKGGIIAFSVLFGFFSGTFVSLPAACVATMTPQLNLLGTRMGMLFFVCGFGVLAGSPIGGALVTRDDGGFLYAIMFCGTCMTLSTIFMVLARVSFAGYGIRTKC